MRSPFDGLRMPRELACEFFAFVSRFEYALKGFAQYRRNQHGLAAPAWRTFGDIIGERMRDLEPGSELSTAVSYLTGQPPQVQLADGSWDERPLEGDMLIAQAIDAALRTRHNLFHGGKHTPHSADGRDEALVRAAMIVLVACLAADHELHAYFDDRF